MIYEPVHQGILIIDIVGFGRLNRRNTTRIRMRDELYRMFEEGLGCALIAESAYALKDLGDGILALFESQIPKSRLLHPLVPHLVSDLEAYNREVSEEARMRLRIAMHAGEDVPHGMEYIGEALNHAFRLLDSNALRQRLATVDAPLAVIVSQLIYDEVVRQGYTGIDPSGYENVRITVKETKRASAWIWTPHSREHGVDSSDHRCCLNGGQATTATPLHHS
jgi:class 3 adenylate cyclase